MTVISIYRPFYFPSFSGGVLPFLWSLFGGDWNGPRATLPDNTPVFIMLPGLSNDSSNTVRGFISVAPRKTVPLPALNRPFLPLTSALRNLCARHASL